MKSYFLPDWVVCPLCRGPLSRARLPEDKEVRCSVCPARFPVREGIPVLLDDKTRALAEEEARRHAAVTPVYHAARHRSPCAMEYLDYWCSEQLSLAPKRPYRRVVELMAGGCELGRRCDGLPKPIVALDLNLEILDLSRDEIIPDIVPVCGSALRLPFADGSVDLVLIQGGLHHVRRSVSDALKEITRCMAPGAALVASEPRNDNRLNYAFRRIFYHLHPHHEEEEEDGFTRSELRGFMERAGLKLEYYEPFAYLGYMLIGNTDLIPLFRGMGRNSFSRFLVGLDRAWRRVPLLRGLAWASFIRAGKPL